MAQTKICRWLHFQPIIETIFAMAIKMPKMQVSKAAAEKLFWKKAISFATNFTDYLHRMQFHSLFLQYNTLSRNFRNGRLPISKNCRTVGSYVTHYAKIVRMKSGIPAGNTISFFSFLFLFLLPLSIILLNNGLMPHYWQHIVHCER